MYGFVKVASAVPQVRVADVKYNVEQIVSMMMEADNNGVRVVVFPELSMTGSTCADLFRQQLLLREIEAQLNSIRQMSLTLSVTTIVGAPVMHNGALYNCAIVIQEGSIVGVVPKTSLPLDSQSRWFASGAALPANAECKLCGNTVPFGTNLLFTTSDFTFAVEVGNDLFSLLPPSVLHTVSGAEIIFNLSAEAEVLGSYENLKQRIIHHSQQCRCAYIYASAGYGESTQDAVLPGYAFVAEAGELLSEGERFAMSQQLVMCEVDVELLRHKRLKMPVPAMSSLLQMPYRSIPVDECCVAEFSPVLSRTVSASPFVPTGVDVNQWCEDAVNIQSEGLAKRIAHTHASTVVLGISGGLDSTLALLVCVRAFDKLGLDRHNIWGITMPGFGTSGRTHSNALSLMKQLGISVREVSIAMAVTQHFLDIQHDHNSHDVVYENSQARERTQILMDIANQLSGMVVGTGDLSELALGWATYNGDHMSMYGVNASIPKTMMRLIVKHLAVTSDNAEIKRVLLDIVDTPISPELIPTDSQGEIAQKTEDLVGPYELHDFFIYHTLCNGFSPSKIFYLAKQAFAQPSQYSEAYDETTIHKWLTVFCRRFFNQQFKRSCMPDGPMVTLCSLSPRGAWAMPSDACSELWRDSALQAVDSL